MTPAAAPDHDQPAEGGDDSTEAPGADTPTSPDAPAPASLPDGADSDAG